MTNHPEIFGTTDAIHTRTETRRASRGLQRSSNTTTLRGMERIAAIEAHLEHARSDLADVKSDVKEHRKETAKDFRVLFGALIFAALGLAGIMAKGFHWI